MTKVIDFTKLSEQSHKELLVFRNQEDVRLQMNNTNIINLKNHLIFVEKLKNDTNNKYWLVKDSNSKENIGVIYLNKLNEDKIFLGIYANVFSKIKNKGSILMTELEKIAFGVYGVAKLFLEVKKQNFRAIRLYDKFSYKVCSASNLSNDIQQMVKLKKQYETNKDK